VLRPQFRQGTEKGRLSRKSEESIMYVEMRPITSIKPYEHNPRLNDASVNAVAACIQAFGFRQPIVVDEDGVIIVGHTR
jgi:site-specific DNA-methyltransferase (adenine-specific)